MNFFDISCGLLVVIILIYCVVSLKINTKIKQNPKQKLKATFRFEPFIKKYQWVIFGILMLVALIVRLWDFGNNPAGTNQDEASVGYDAYAIANYGTDRCGYPFPVYPISWGSGTWPFYTYFTVLFVKLFGLSTTVYRLPNALLAIAAVAIFYFTLKRLHNFKVAMLGLFLLAICPWHIMLSRWGLDANPLPAVFMLAVYFLVLGLDTGKNRSFYIAAGVFGLCMYAYGSAFVVLPIFFVLAFSYLLYHKKISVKTLLVSGGAFVLVGIPIFIFMIINIFKLPEIITPYISFPRFISMRSASIFKDFSIDVWGALGQSAYYYAGLVLAQLWDGLVWNGIPQFGILYFMSVPLVIAGGIVAFSTFKIKEYKREIIFLSWFIGASVLAFLVEPNVNRINIIFLPVVYFAVLGLDFIGRRAKLALPVLVVLFAVSFGMFCNVYFGQYKDVVGKYFFASFGDAVQFAAQKTNGEIFIDENVNGNYVLTLFYLKSDPKEFYTTVKYYNPTEEFRMAEHFGRFTFRTPQNKERDKVYVIPNERTGEFNPKEFNIKKFENYSVAYGK